MSTHVSLRQMRYFVAVAEARSFRLAAERLHMTQPPLSRQVAELEAVLGVSLLRREVRGLELTAAGMQALQDFCTLLADAEAASARISALRDALPLLRLGWVSWLDMSRLRPIELNEVPPFYRFRRAVNPALHDHFDSQYRAHGFVPQHEAASGDLMSVLARVGAGEGCTCMPVPMAVHRYAGVVRRALHEVVTMDLALVHATHLPAALQLALLDATREVAPWLPIQS